jgi:membrane peptidoglycan carboxypeptidase
LKEPARYRTKSGRLPRARVHAGWSPLGRRRARVALVRILGVLLGLFLVGGLAAGVYAESFLGSLESVSGLDSTGFQGDTLIYDRNGQLLADYGEGGNHRVNVTLDQISPKLVAATVAVEDKNFWTNPGFDPEGIVRAALTNVRSRSIVGGGSTITQQLAKQRFLTSQQTLDRKLKEIVYAYQLNRTYSKQKILELYLNLSYYGEQQYGVQSASKTFFGRNARELDLAQAAMLAGLPQAPEQWSPVAHPQASKLRQKQVLDAMVRVGSATPEAAQAAYQENLDVRAPTTKFLAPQFISYVKSELERLGFKPGPQQLIVKTTLDYNKQQLGEQVVRESWNSNKWRDKNGAFSAALVSMDPRTGQIVAYVGNPGSDTSKGQYDWVNDVPQNPGSSVKPYTYAAAIAARKATMDTPILDGPSPLPVQGGYQVYNFVHKPYGVQPLKVAFASSLNISAVKTELGVGIPQTLAFYRNLGLKPLDFNGDPNGPDSGYGPTLTLGGHAITLLEHVGAISVLADLGVYHQPEAILQVSDAKGRVLYQADPNRGSRKAIEPGVAFIVSSILEDDNNRALVFGRGSPLHLGDRHAAAKTGTTENFHDALTVGWTPDLATVVWLGGTAGRDDVMCNCQSDAVYVAAPAWHKYMDAALKTTPDSWYQPPADVIKGANNSWFLQDAPRVDRLPNDNPIASPTPNYGVPNDPGTGPVKAGAGQQPPVPFPFPLPPQPQPGRIRPLPPPQP